MNIFEEVRTIISDCEDIQKSNESQYTKEQAKISAYDDIIKILRDVMDREDDDLK